MYGLLIFLMKKIVSVRDAMTKKPVVVGPETSLIKAVKKMLKEGVGSLIVEENEILRGIVTEKDFTEKVVLKNLDCRKETVKNIMTKSIITVSPTRDVMEAVRIMNEHGFRKLPVVEDDKLVGMLTMEDVLRIQPQLFDLLVEKGRVGVRNTGSFDDGDCSECGSFTLVKKMIDDRWLCSECESKDY